MKNFKNLFLASTLLTATALTGCLHIIEEATFRNNGSGSYKMTLDMSELKGMMEMMKGMGGDMPGAETGDSTNLSDGGDFTPPPPPPAPEEDPMGGLSEQFAGVADLLSKVDGISNVLEIKDTSTFQAGYSFDFANIAALNRALKIVGKDKFESKNEETFKFNGKNFERLNVGDISAEFKNAMSGGDESEEAEGQADMMKMFLADMSYKQIYHFPDRKVKKSDNKFGEVDGDGHTLTIKLKPFDEEQQKKKASVAAKVKLN